MGPPLFPLHREYDNGKHREMYSHKRRAEKCGQLTENNVNDWHQDIEHVSCLPTYVERVFSDEEKVLLNILLV